MVFIKFIKPNPVCVFKHLRMKKVKLVSLRKLHLSGSLSDRQATKQYNLEDS